MSTPRTRRYSVQWFWVAFNSLSFSFSRAVADWWCHVQGRRLEPRPAARLLHNLWEAQQPWLWANRRYSAAASCIDPGQWAVSAWNASEDLREYILVIVYHSLYDSIYPWQGGTHNAKESSFHHQRARLCRADMPSSCICEGTCRLKRLETKHSSVDSYSGFQGFWRSTEPCIVLWIQPCMYSKKRRNHLIRNTYTLKNTIGLEKRLWLVYFYVIYMYLHVI